jgi:amino acid permease
MLGYFLVLGALVILIHLFFGELSLETPDFKRLPSFAKIYLGNVGERVAYVSTVLGTFGSILAYLIVGGEFLENLLSPIFGGGNLIWTLIYFSAGALLIFFGIKIIAKIEFWGVILFFVALILIFFRGKGLINVENLFIGNWTPPIHHPLEIGNLFLPYGPILFSLWGASLIPEAEEMLKENKNLLKIVIPISILISIFIYLLFTYLILGICGPQTTESALTGLKNFLDFKIFSLALLFGVLTTFTSFIALGLTLKKVFWYDLKIEKNLAFFITCFIPLILFLMGVKSFIQIISFVGGVMLGIDGILILLMYQRKTKNFLIYPLVLIFLAGIIYEIIYL